MIRVFIDGREGTTGLQIEERLAVVPGIELLEIDPELRKDESERKRLLNNADCAFLCLPDAPARRAAALVENPDTVIIDASTAHRTDPLWAYGFPELSESHERALRLSNRIAVPGCHASGFCALVYPLVRAGAIARDARLSCTSLSGYSGGGKGMIAAYEGESPPRGARPYALGLGHKHLPEMAAVCGLMYTPLFQPVVAPVRQGMLVSVPLFEDAEKIHAILERHYRGGGDVAVMPLGAGPEDGFMQMEALNGTDRMELFIFGHASQALLMARLDNLGKGAAGAAVRCMRLRFGL